MTTFKVFKFAADNTDVEWVVHKNGDSYTLGTIHNSDTSGGWVDYGLEKPDASVHSHPGIGTSEADELYSMGAASGRAKRFYDWYNVRQDVKANGKNARMSYVYFPNSSHLYYVGYSGPQYIRNIGNYKRFYFGTLNNR